MSGRVAAIGSYALALAAASWILASQPLGSPWYSHADADATYAGSALNLAAGGHTKYFDHPGLPLQVVGAVGFAVQHAVEGKTDSMHRFAGDLMLNLDQARPVYRTIAALLYLLGVTVAFLISSRALGHPLWGLAGAILWLGAPLISMSTQFRPDVLLSWLVLVCGYLIVRGYEQRDPVRLLGGAFLVGFTIMVKLHAAGLLPALIVAVLLAAPIPDWRPRLAAWARSHRNSVTAALTGWLVLAAFFDVSRLPFRPALKGVAILLAGVVASAAWLLVGRRRPGSRLLGSFNGAVLAALVAGVFVPVLVVLDDGLRSLPWVVDALLGRGINSGVGHLTDFSLFVHTPLLEALVVFALAGISAAIGALRREWSDSIWFLASTVMALLAFERMGTVHYFGPAYVLAIVPALRLARRAGPAAPLAAAALVLAVAVPQIAHVDDARGSSRATATTEAALSRLLGPHQVAMTAAFEPLPDTLWFSLLAVYASWVPPYPYRTLPATPKGEWALAAQHLTPRFFVSSRPLTSSNTGDYTVRLAKPVRVGSDYAYRLTGGPGVDQPVPAAAPAGVPLIAPP